MKVLLACTLLSVTLAACAQNADCSVSFLQPQQPPQPTLSLNPLTWTSALNSAVFQSIDQVLEQIFDHLYGEEEGKHLIDQVKSCQTQKLNSLVGIGARMLLLTPQFINLCRVQDQDTAGNRLFSQVVDILVPLVTPCALDRDIAADLLVAQWMSLSQARQSNSTAFEGVSRTGLNLTERLFHFSDSLVANFSHSLQSMADRHLLDEDQVPLLVDLMNTFVTESQQTYVDLLTDIGTDPAQALSKSETDIDDMISSLAKGLHSLQVPEDEVESLTGTLHSLISEMNTAISTLLQDPAATDEADNSLEGLTEQLSAAGKEAAQILVSLVAQNVDEFCASRAQSAKELSSV